MKPRRQAPVLVVERDAAVRDAITALLETMGFRAVGVGDGHALDAFLHRQRPCMIVADVLTDGYDLRAAQRSDRRLADVPVIGLVSAGAAGDAVSLATVGSVAKPIDFDELERLLERHCPD